MDSNLSKKRSTSQDLMKCGRGAALSDKLLLKPKASSSSSSSSSSLQTERVPRSNVLARLQDFLPQMAAANEKLRLQMEAEPSEVFDIESVEDGQTVIEMDVGLYELDGDDSDVEDSEDTSASDSDGDTITEENLKLPGNKATKGHMIQMLQERQ